jgi:hypothetical protein
VLQPQLRESCASGEARRSSAFRTCASINRDSFEYSDLGQ